MKTIQSYTINPLSSTTLMIPKGTRILGTDFIRGMVYIHALEPHLEEERIERIFITIQNDIPFEEEENELTTLSYIGTVLTDLKAVLHVFEIQW